MAREWDEIARQNPYYSIFAWPEFEDPGAIDEARFWRSGRVQVDNFLEHLRLGDTSGLVLLEIGCGIGRMTHRFAERFREVYAVDASREMIARAASRWGHLANVRFIAVDGEDLAVIDDASIDLVFSFLVLQHVTSPEIVLGYLRECGRVLRAGGTAFLQLRTGESGLRGFLRRLVGREERRPRHWFAQGLDWQPPTRATPEKTAAIREKAAWKGCRVPLGEVLRTCRRSGLEVGDVEGGGTQYTFLTAVKRT
jgi:SAM-dependent methyltransferase